MESRYRFMTDEEFLRLCHDKRTHSPIIEELCWRLEESLDSKPDKGTIDENTFTSLQCPICETPLLVSGTEIEGHLQITICS